MMSSKCSRCERSHVSYCICVRCKLWVGAGGITSDGPIRARGDAIADAGSRVGKGGIMTSGGLSAAGRVLVENGALDVGAGGVSSAGAVATEGASSVGEDLAVDGAGGIDARMAFESPRFEMMSSAAPTSIVASADAIEPQHLVTPPVDGSMGLVSLMSSFGEPFTSWSAQMPLASSFPLSPSGSSPVRMQKINHQYELVGTEYFEVVSKAQPADTLIRVVAFGGGGGGGVLNGGGGGGTVSFLGSREAWAGAHLVMAAKGRGGGGGAGGTQSATAGGTTVLNTYYTWPANLPAVVHAYGGGPGSATDAAGGGGGGGGGFVQTGGSSRGGLSSGSLPSGGAGGVAWSENGGDGFGFIAAQQQDLINSYFTAGAGAGGTFTGTATSKTLGGDGGDAISPDLATAISVSVGGKGSGIGGAALIAGGGASFGRGGGLVGGLVRPPVYGGGGSTGFAGAPGGVIVQYGN
jgi:hypothetical protein